MRNFCLFIAFLLILVPLNGSQADVLDYFEDAEYEFCTYEEPGEEADAVFNGLFWEVRAGADRREVFAGLKDVKAVSVTTRSFDQKKFFRDFRVTVLSVQELPDVTIYYCLSGNSPAADTGNMQIAVRKDLAKIGIPALLNSY